MAKVVGLGAVVVVVLSFLLLGGTLMLVDGQATAANLAAATSTGMAQSGIGQRPGSLRTEVPTTWEVLDRAAAGTCPGLPWSVLAAIGDVESNSGQSGAPGVHGGANAAGAEGPMQFEPATFAAYATGVPGGATPLSPYDPVDAVYAAAHMLCADGAGQRAGVSGAVFSYNHSSEYVGVVLVLAAALGTDPTLSATAAGALKFAASKLGIPYLWGGTGRSGYDCSGLVQAASASVGLALPRVAQDQFNAGPAVPPGTAPLPGDLVFFGKSRSSVEHVGMYVAGGEMIDAPYTGTVIRLDTISDLSLVGVTQPL